MKKSKFLFGITALIASMVMMGCELELGDLDDRIPVSVSGEVPSDTQLLARVNASSGFTLSFTYNDDDTDAWGIILYDETDYRLCVPNIDNWWSNDRKTHGNVQLDNKGITIYDESITADSFATGEDVFVKIQMSTDGIYWFVNGTKAFYYPGSLAVGTPTIADIVELWATAINNGTAVLHPSKYASGSTQSGNFSADTYTMKDFALVPGLK